MTAASGADRACPLCAGVDPRHISPIIQAHHAAHANVREDRRRQAGADHAAFERARADLANQPTLRDQLAEEAGCHGLNIGVDQRLVLCTCGWRHQDEENLTRPVAAWSLHVADALLPVVERAKAEAAAEALEQAARTRNVVPGDELRARAAALRSNAGGDRS